MLSFGHLDAQFPAVPKWIPEKKPEDDDMPKSNASRSQDTNSQDDPSDTTITGTQNDVADIINTSKKMDAFMKCNKDVVSPAKRIKQKILRP